MYEALKPYWYPLALSTDVADKPVAAELLGERVAIYRAGGKVRAVRDLCIHRGTPLSLGAGGILGRSAAELADRHHADHRDDDEPVYEIWKIRSSEKR